MPGRDDLPCPMFRVVGPAGTRERRRRCGDAELWLSHGLGCWPTFRRPEEGRRGWSCTGGASICGLTRRTDPGPRPCDPAVSVADGPGRSTRDPSRFPNHDPLHRRGVRPSIQCQCVEPRLDSRQRFPCSNSRAIRVGRGGRHRWERWSSPLGEALPSAPPIY